jgi:outer membrane receptor protein involved in Fe transport
VIALQKKSDNVDWQLAYYTRYSDLHFTPDPLGDLVFNGVASNVQRQSFANGVQGDGSYVSKLGWLLGVYLQDEWKLTDKLTLNFGIRFDQMYQFVDANQWSPRVSLTYKPFDGTTLHAGYARYFTPPTQVIASPTNVVAFNNTTQASQTCGGNDPPGQSPCGSVLPERAHYFDAGIVQRLFPGFELGVDGYYKIARDLLDDGQFGAALVLDGFNYAKAFNQGIEIKANYQAGNFKVYGNIAFAEQKGTDIVSNQFLFSPDELAFIANNYIYTDHSQTITASSGFTYLWQGTRFSADMIYGSGLRSGFANTDHVPAYTQVNLGLSHEFAWGVEKPATVRFDIINLFNKVYEIRDGSGIGVFAPQFGPRREFLLGLSQKF